MSQDCVLLIKDEANIALTGLDAATRRKLVQAVEYFQPWARYSPQFRLGRWNGKISFCDVGGRTYLNLLDKLLPIVQEAGYLISIDDRRLKHDFKFDLVDENSYNHVVWPEGHVKAGEPITLREHQVEAINIYLNNLQSVGKISTGSGKTLISAILAHKTEVYGRTITIVPSKDLVVQTERDFKLLGLDVGVYFGDRKEPGHQHIICTWQSIEALDKKSKKYDLELDIDDFTQGINTFIVDEAHGSKAQALQKHLTSTFAGVPIRWGMTGTIPPEEYDKISLICAIGPTVNNITAKDLQDKGILSNLHITVAQIQDYDYMFTNYASELKYLVTDLERLKYIAKYIQPHADSGNTLILVDRIETGEILKELLPGSVFINGSVKSDDRKDEYKSFQTTDNNIIIATYGVAAVGIDIPRIFNLFMLESGKSFIKVIQSIGRGIRKAEDKDFVNIFDLCSALKYSKRHLTERKKFYKQEQYPFKVVKLTP